MCKNWLTWDLMKFGCSEFRSARSAIANRCCLGWYDNCYRTIIVLNEGGSLEISFLMLRVCVENCKCFCYCCHCHCHHAYRWSQVREILCVRVARNVTQVAQVARKKRRAVSLCTDPPLHISVTGKRAMNERMCWFCCFVFVFVESSYTVATMNMLMIL